MKISAKAEYACLAVLALAQQGPDVVTLRIREISQEYGIPERYLVQILLQLKGAGLVASTRGASGGYRLARPASSISLSRDPGRRWTVPTTRVAGHPRRKRPAASVLAPVWESVRAAERACSTTPRSPSSPNSHPPTNGSFEAQEPTESRRLPIDRLQRSSNHSSP